MRRTLAFVIAIVLLGAASAVGMAWFAAGVARLEIRELALLQWIENIDGGREAAWAWTYGHSWNRRAWRVLSIVPGERSPLGEPALAPPAWSRARMEPA
ncbi:MAG: hypothetical protein FJ253_05645, partial [Phycisphaerae bacterium]|nr:hypothetical protein [Phycisphaerae bacterium]